MREFHIIRHVYAMQMRTHKRKKERTFYCYDYSCHHCRALSCPFPTFSPPFCSCWLSFRFLFLFPPFFPPFELSVCPQSSVSPVITTIAQGESTNTNAHRALIFSLFSDMYMYIHYYFTFPSSIAHHLRHQCFVCLNCFFNFLPFFFRSSLAHPSLAFYFVLSLCMTRRHGYLLFHPTRL